MTLCLPLLSTLVTFWVFTNMDIECFAMKVLAFLDFSEPQFKILTCPMIPLADGQRGRQRGRASHVMRGFDDFSDQVSSVPKQEPVHMVLNQKETFSSTMPQPVYVAPSQNPTYASPEPEPVYVVSNEKPVFVTPKPEPVFIVTNPELKFTSPDPTYEIYHTKHIYTSPEPEPVYTVSSQKTAFTTSKPKPVFIVTNPELKFTSADPTYEIYHKQPIYSSPQPDLIPLRFELYQPCRSSYDCLIHIPYSHCDYSRRVCTCQNHHIPYNNSMCLPASLLGYPCVLDSQCRVKVAHSRCIDGKCSCEANHVPLRLDKCLPPVKVGDYCLNDMQCAYSDDYSYCKFILPRVYGRCQCPLGYFVTQDKGCLPHLGNHCIKHDDCQLVTPNSICHKENNTAVCRCSEGYEPSSNLLSCKEIEQVKVISLGKACTRREDCQIRDPYSDCLNGTCECISPDDTCSAQKPGCFEDSFQCRSGHCISWFFVCDGHLNCPDQSDEDECFKHDCPKLAFTCDDGTCLPRSAVCNGHWECPDGSDEARCYTGIPCDKNAFRCRNGQCLPQFAFCNSVLDCADGSDELEELCNIGVNCTGFGKHHCGNGRCRSTAILCSNMDGCGDNTDENRCDVCYCKKP